MKQQPQITQEQYLAQVMANSKDVSCTCGGQFFRQVFTMRSVSKLFTGQPTDTLVPLPMFRCDDCGKPVEQLKVPEPPKQPSKLISE